MVLKALEKSMNRTIQFWLVQMVVQLVKECQNGVFSAFVL